MQAFKVPMTDRSNFYFCSLACAAMAGFPPQDGQFYTESGYSIVTQCSNCNITINDSERARQVFQIVFANPRKQKKKHIPHPPEPSYNQHPQYEEWKTICPSCRDKNTQHVSGSREYEVVLGCSHCGRKFLLKEAFEAELARQKAGQ